MFFSLFKKSKTGKIGIQAGYDLWSTHYAEEKNPIKAASDQSVKDLLPDLSGKSVLDAGCGTGYFCRYAEQAGARKVIGIDFSEGMVNQARQNCPKTQFFVGEIQALNGIESVDVIICALVLGHVHDLHLVLSRFADNLANNGILVITDFHPVLSENGQKRTFTSANKVFEIPHHIHPIEKYQTSLIKLGFIVEEVKDVLWGNLPVVFAIKARKKEM